MELIFFSKVLGTRQNYGIAGDAGITLSQGGLSLQAELRRTFNNSIMTLREPWKGYTWLTRD